MPISTEDRTRIAQQKLAEMKAGKRVITNDNELDLLLAQDDDAIYSVRTLPNPQRVGVLDQYVGWID